MAKQAPPGTGFPPSVLITEVAAVIALLGRGRQAWAGRIPGGTCAALALWLVWLYRPGLAG